MIPNTLKVNMEMFSKGSKAHVRNTLVYVSTIIIAALGVSSIMGASMQ